MSTMKKIRADISNNDRAKRFTDNYGIDIYFGHAKFTSKNTVEVNGKTLSFVKACIATGARPKVPAIDGLSKIRYYTSDSIFNMVEQPKKLLIIGGGPIACELGQGFARLGTEVAMMVRGKKILPKDDLEASDLLTKQMEKDGVNFMFGVVPSSFT